jgi:hypothetical protein
MAAKLKIEKRGDEIKKNLLLWNYWANLNQTLLKWSAKFGCGGHLGRRAEPPDIFLEENHTMTSSSTFSSYWANGFRRQSQPSFAEMILGWSPSKIMSGISDLQPRWPPQPNLV